MSEPVSSPSALIYAFADRVNPAPTGDAELAALLLAVAAWGLREQGTIALAPLAHPRPADGRLGFNRLRAYADQPGLEGALLHSMTGKGKRAPGVSILGLLTTALPMGFQTEARPNSLRHAIETGPWRGSGAVIALCRREARRTGVVGRFGRGEPDSGHELRFSQLRSSWNHFASMQPELYASLMSDCAAGLRR